MCVIIIEKQCDLMLHVSHFFNFYFLGIWRRVWRISSRDPWTVLEEIPFQFLRIHSTVGEAVPVFHHLRSALDGQRHFVAHSALGFSGIINCLFLLNLFTKMSVHANCIVSSRSKTFPSVRRSEPSVTLQHWLRWSWWRPWSTLLWPSQST